MDKSVEEIIIKLQKEDDAIAKAKIIQYLHREKALSLKEISTKLKLHSSYISHFIRILQLPMIVLDGYYAKQISSAHLFILSRLKKEEEILNAYKTILSNGLTSAQTEELVREIKFTVSTTDKQLSKEQRNEIIDDIKKSFPGVDVHINQTRVKGKIILELKGETEKTTEFLKEIGDKLIQRSYPDFHDDTLQVLE